MLDIGIMSYRTKAEKQRSEDLEILTGIIQAVHESDSLQEIYSTALDSVIKLENIDIVGIYIVDEKTNEAVLEAHKNVPEWFLEKGSRIPYPKGITWKVINTGEIINIEDSQKDPDMGPAGRQLGLHSFLGIPIHLEEKVIGVIWFLSHMERRFDQREVDLLTTLGRQIAIAIARMKYTTELEESKRKLEERNGNLSFLSRLSTIIHGSNSLDHILKTVWQMSREISFIDLMGIYLAEGEGDKREAVLKIHRGYTDEFVERAGRIPYGKGVTWKVIESGEINYYDDASDPSTSVGEAGKAMGARAVLSIPVKTEDRTIGVIHFSSYEKASFSTEEFDLLYSIGHQLGTAIAKTRILDEMKKLARAIEQAEDIVFITNRDGVIEYVNTAFTRLTGFTREELTGKTPSILRSGKHSRKFYRKLWDTILSGNHFSGEFINRKKDGSLYHESKTITPVKNEAGEITHFVSTGKDITERKRLEEKLTELAHHDYLTGVLNRYRFEKEISDRLQEAGRLGKGGALILFDLDNFKIINDSFGHQTGDQILVRFSGLISDMLRLDDTLARVGGDEFAVFIPDADVATAENITNRMITSVNSYKFESQGRTFRTSMSAGFALFPEHGNTTEELFAKADLALFESKEKGGNCLSIYAPDETAQSQIRSRRQWITRISESIENDGFVLFAQPVVSIKDRSVSHYEILLRMKDDNGIVEPGSFLGISERTGIIRNIDHWVVRNTISLVSEQIKKGRGICFSINISNQSFLDNELLRVLKHELDKSPIDPKYLQFEVTETATISSLDRTRHFIDELRQMGFSFVLDDFGAGFSSLNHLKHLKVDYLKIDGDFIRRLHVEPVDQHIVRNIVHLARGFRMKLIAEHVESEETLDFLRRFRVHFVQGNYISPPVPVEDIL